MTTTGNLGRQAPAGHRWVWRPTAEVELGVTWEVLGADALGRPCRYGRRPGQKGCGAQAVARLNVADDQQWPPQWVDYCQRHLFSRQILDGILHTCVWEPIPGGEAA